MSTTRVPAVDPMPQYTDTVCIARRCRYLEEAGCASICINSCKVPTQEFFRTEMGLNVTLEPNYEDFSCQFVFGKTPLPEASDDIMTSPCFTQCPSKRARPGQSKCGGVEPAGERSL